MEGGRIRVAKQYLIQKKLGSGSFGEVYQGLNQTTNEEVAIKLEESQSKFPQVISEAKILSSLQGPGFPKVFWYGSEGRFNIMIQELLGSSLEDVFTKNDRRFSLKSILNISEQIFTRIESVHSQSFIHRDIKPDNFMFGSGKKHSILYIIDFGLSKKYRDSKTKQHIKFSDKRTLTGTARYASINSHLGHEQSRRDDLEAIMYLIIYLFLGALPWQGVQCNNKMEKYRTIMDIKINSTPEILCKTLPVEISQMLAYARGLRFEDSPDYSYFKSQIAKIAEKENIQIDQKFEWNSVKPKRKKKKKKTKVSEKSIEDVKFPQKEDDIKTLLSNNHWPEFLDREKIFKNNRDLKEVIKTPEETLEDKNCVLM
jgi:casein kinase 1